MVKLFPSILPDGEDFVDSEYSREELERKEWADLREIAANHPKDTVDGKSDKQTILDELEGEERVNT